MDRHIHVLAHLFGKPKSPAHGAADRQHNDFLCASDNGIPVDFFKIGRTGQGRSRYQRIFFEPLIKLYRSQVNPVMEQFVSPYHTQRNHVNSVLVNQCLGNVTGTIGNQCSRIYHNALGFFDNILLVSCFGFY